MRARSARTTPQRKPEKMSQDRALLDALLSQTILAHVAFLVDGAPRVLPTAFAVVDDNLVIHGSTGSRWMRAMLEQETSVAISRVSGVVVGRSLFHSSLHYQSAVLFGRFSVVPADKTAAVSCAFSDRIIPSRSVEVRESTPKELAATVFYQMPIEEWSLRVSENWPGDEPEDIEGDAWAGVVALGAPTAEVLPAPDLREGIPVPESVHCLSRDPRGIV